MRVFVTGASGFVGSAVVRELLSAGHQVLGLARSKEGADALAAGGAEVLRGSLEDAESLRQGAARADGVIHTAFNHDFSRFAQNCELDRCAIETLGAALEGSGRALIVTAGLGHLVSGRAAIEDDIPAHDPAVFPRVSEAALMPWVARGVRGMVVRLPPSVHGAGDHGFVPILIRIARDKGVSVYGGDGLHRWSSVHRFDAARVYRLALEKGAAGSRWHAVAEEGVPFKEIAGVIGRRLNLPVVSKSVEEAAAHFGWFARFAAMDASASSAHTRTVLGWQAEQAGLIADLDPAAYFA